MPDNLTNLPLSMSVKMVQGQKEVELIELDKPNSTQFSNLPPGVVIERMGNIKQVTKDSASKTPDITRSETSKTAKGPGRPRSNNKSTKKPGESIPNGKKPSNGNIGVQGN